MTATRGSAASSPSPATMRRLLARLACANHNSLSAAAAAARPFTTGAALAKNSLPPRPKPPPDADIEESFLKGSGPGGQKIARALAFSSPQNKTNSAVQLKHIPTGIVVKSQATRSRSQNRKHARELLAQKVDDLLHGDQSRSAIVGKVKRKKAASAAKKSRRKYKMLDEDKAADAGARDKAPQEITANNNHEDGSATTTETNSTNQHQKP
ncbi:Putative peptide chain release factor-like protein, mitochondrial [Tolypocladium paradoxum]|uniref:Peptide chain release factor-like protein, mitochondrial n=1 Tax=Tolypocladium paradoxum TaxID=94208 RepID=A0A2S4L215_9HYPO|nr:Putative peptide chain release factor-like protein, mitochondrial [Tolypocladium paradoxum]